MTSSISLETPPRDISFGRLMIDSQFLHFPKWAPESTNLAGQTAIITGASTGLGLETGRQLLGFGLARLVMAVRSPQKGEAAAADLRRDFPKARIDVWELEMESYTSVRAFAARVDAELARIDTVILNAGIVGAEFETCRETGHEKVIQVNYLSTMLLAILLLPILKAKKAALISGKGGPDAKIPHQIPHLTIVNSGVSLASGHPWEDTRPLLPAFDDTAVMAWNNVERYWSSKLLGQLFFIKLFPYVSADDVVFNMVDPGYIRGTGLSREATGIVAAIMWLSKVIMGRRVSWGASTYVDAAVVRGQESHGCFIMDWDIRPFAKFAYSDKGKENIEVLWRETLEEFKFANVEGILTSLRK